MPARDRRIWEPDESCQPFVWETALASAGGSVGSFRVPPGNLAVIYAYLIVSQTAVAKETARWNIVPESATAQPIRLSGALTEVAELSSTGANLPGLTLCTHSGARPCRILLEAGAYFIVQTGNAGVIVGLVFSGYTFRPRP